MSVSRREELAREIKSTHKVAIGFASSREIEKYNIFNASFLAMKRALENLNVKKGTVLVDGKHKIPKLKKPFKQIPVIKGDQRVFLIGAASIFAKVSRDELLIKLAKKYPHYGFEFHKGYPTKKHKQALLQFGPCSEHRSTFSGVKEFFTTEKK